MIHRSPGPRSGPTSHVRAVLPGAIDAQSYYSNLSLLAAGDRLFDVGCVILRVWRSLQWRWVYARRETIPFQPAGRGVTKLRPAKPVTSSSLLIFLKFAGVGREKAGRSSGDAAKQAVPMPELRRQGSLFPIRPLYSADVFVLPMQYIYESVRTSSW